jgi:hypothetical protein
LSDALDDTLLEAHRTGKELVVVHGGARGADSMAEQWARQIGVRTEVHRANWKRDGMRGGFKRNEEMVNLGADRCLAFGMPCDKHPSQPPHITHGTDHCLRLATNAGIPSAHITPREGVAK